MGHYIDSGKIEAMFPQVVATAGSQPGTIEFFIQLAEAEIDGRLGRFWDLATFSGNAPPLITVIDQCFAAHAYLRTLVTLEDPSRSDWVSQLREQGEALITKLESGTLAMVSGSGTVIAPMPSTADLVWSSTDDKGYKPTFDLRDSVEQHISRTRLRDERDADIADSGILP